MCAVPGRCWKKGKQVKVEGRMEYVLGIDGGGSKTHLLAAARDMRVLWESFGLGIGLNGLPKDMVRARLATLLRDFFQAGGLSAGDCRFVCLGVAGAGRPSGRRVYEEILGDSLDGIPFRATHDAEGALAGGIPGGIGLLLSSGTGSICYGRNAAGEVWRTGGWGHIVGDEGSGYAIGRACLNAVVRQQDGRGASTLLTEKIMAHWALDGFQDLVDKIYAPAGKDEIAGLAPLCGEAYNAGDPVAVAILKAAARELAEMALTVAGRFWERPEAVTCVCAGGVLEKMPQMLPLIERELADQLPALTLARPAHSGAWGCAALGWREIG